MNLVSFIDELVKLGTGKVLMKGASIESDPHAGLVGNSTYKEEDPLVPGDADTRLPLTAGTPTSIMAGRFGLSSPAKDPIDEPSMDSTARTQ